MVVQDIIVLELHFLSLYEKEVQNCTFFKILKEYKGLEGVRRDPWPLFAEKWFGTHICLQF